MSGQPQRGAAILMAMLTVALVASLAAAAMLGQWRAVEVETAQRSQQQARWLLLGAMDWSRLLLRQDAQSSRGRQVDHLDEPWALPLRETRLASFLSAPGGVSNVDDASTDTTQAYLSGQILDAQARLNVRNLVGSDGLDATAGLQFARLFERLRLPPAMLRDLQERLRDSLASPAPKGAALQPQHFSQLLWLGLSAPALAQLEPYAIWLPERTLVNLNTASAEVIWASAPGLDWAQAQRLVSARQKSHFQKLEDASALVGTEGAISASTHSIQSNYFEANGQLRMDHTRLNQRILLHRQGQEVRPVAVLNSFAMPDQ